MKIIDEKGRLFGKINLIDFLAIIFLFGFTPIFYLGYKIFQHNKKIEVVVEEPKEFIDIDLNCRWIKLTPQTLKLVAVGDKEIDSDGKVIGELTWVGENKPYKYRLDIGAEEPISKEDLELREIPVRLKIKVNVKDGSLYYKDKPITVNSSFDFVTGKYNLEAIPIGKGELKKTKEIGDNVKVTRRVKIDLNLIFNNLTEDIIRLIAVGDKGLDEKGEVVAEILDIGKIENNRLNIDLGKNNFINVEDKAKRQVSVKIKLEADMDEERNLYFNNKRVEHNLPVQFKTNRYIIEGIVAQVLAKERWVEVQVKFSGILPEITRLLKKGDTEKKSTGSTLAVLKDIISDEPTKIQTLIVQEQKFITLSSPFQRDIMANLALLCEERDIGLFFKDYAIKVGNIIAFTTDLYSLSGTITNLEIK